MTIVAADPAAHRAMLLAFTGASEAKPNGEGYLIPLPRGSLSVTTPRGFVERFGAAGPDPGAGARLAAIGFDVSDVHATHVHLQQTGIAVLRRGDGLVIPPNSTLGATLMFGPAG